MESSSLKEPYKWVNGITLKRYWNGGKFQKKKIYILLTFIEPKINQWKTYLTSKKENIELIERRGILGSYRFYNKEKDSVGFQIAHLHIDSKNDNSYFQYKSNNAKQDIRTIRGITINLDDDGILKIKIDAIYFVVDLIGYISNAHKPNIIQLFYFYRGNKDSCYSSIVILERSSYKDEINILRNTLEVDDQIKWFISNNSSFLLAPNFHKISKK